MKYMAFIMSNNTLVNYVLPFEGKKVKVHYKERFKTLAWLGDTNYNATIMSPLELNSILPIPYFIFF